MCVVSKTFKFTICVRFMSGVGRASNAYGYIKLLLMSSVYVAVSCLVSMSKLYSFLLFSLEQDCPCRRIYIYIYEFHFRVYLDRLMRAYLQT
jgi:hypothetical protein